MVMGFGSAPLRMNGNVADLLVCIAFCGVHKAATAEEEAGSEHEVGQEVAFPHDDKRRVLTTGQFGRRFQDRGFKGFKSNNSVKKKSGKGKKKVPTRERP